jgi:hypothetical protein
MTVSSTPMGNLHSSSVNLSQRAINSESQNHDDYAGIGGELNQIMTGIDTTRVVLIITLH